MKPPADSRDTATWGALFGLLTVAVGLLGLMAIVAPHVFGIVLIGVGLLGFGAFHYLVWGWWLGQSLSQTPEVDSGEKEES